MRSLEKNSTFGVGNIELHQPANFLNSGIFQSSDSQLNHHRQDSQITRSKTSYSLIKPQPLPQGNLEIPLPPNSLDLHQPKKQ